MSTTPAPERFLYELGVQVGQCRDVGEIEFDERPSLAELIEAIGDHIGSFADTWWARVDPDTHERTGDDEVAPPSPTPDEARRAELAERLRSLAVALDHADRDPDGTRRSVVLVRDVELLDAAAKALDGKDPQPFECPDGCDHVRGPA